MGEPIDIRLDEAGDMVITDLTQRTVGLFGVKGSGKGLALDTELPTPDGFIRMGDVQIGDTVLDEEGRPCKVTFVSGVNHRPCFRVTFDDGTSLIADDEHQWHTLDFKQRSRARRLRSTGGGKGSRSGGVDNRRYGRIDDWRDCWGIGSVRTTPELAASLDCSQKDHANHFIPLARPLALMERILPIDPYALGAWLGDGTRTAAIITCSEPELIAHVAEKYQLSKYQYRPNEAPQYRLLGAEKLLREANLLDNKHIPMAYLRASHEQRLALLQGIMDTDGHCSRHSNCEITFTNRRLIEDVRELVSSLGMKPGEVEVKRATIDGVDMGPAYRIHFTATLPVFRLARKLVAFNHNNQQRSRYTAFRVVNVEPVESVPTKCIQVDSPRSLYLATRSLIPTHNTYTMGVIMEELSRQRVRYVLLDPIGAMAKKEREKERVAPANEAYFKAELSADNGMQIAELMCQPNMRRISFQLDLSGLDQPDRVAFVEGLCEGLLLHNSEDLIFIADEVQNFVPSKPMKGQVAGKGNVVRLFAEGRNRNIGAVIASQRLAKVHADVRELVDCIIFHQLIHALSLKAAEELLRHNTTSDDELQAILARIQVLETGQVYFFDPSAINPNRNKGERPKMRDAVHVEGPVKPLDGQEALPDRGPAKAKESAAKEAPAPDEGAEEAVEAEGKAILDGVPHENLPPPRVTDLFRFDQALATGKVVEARWDAGAHGSFRALAQVGKATDERFEVHLIEDVAAGKSTYPKGHRLVLPRYAKSSWGPLNGVFPMPTTGKAGDPAEVFQATKEAAVAQGLSAGDAREVAKGAVKAAEGAYTVRPETPKGERLAKAAKKHGSAKAGDEAEFEQVIIASEPAAAQTHITKHGRPGDEVYVDDDFSPEQLHPLAVHERVEELAIRKGLTQQDAHQVANAAERATAGHRKFERGVREAQKVAEKARIEVGIIAPMASPRPGKGKAGPTSTMGPNGSTSTVLRVENLMLRRALAGKAEKMPPKCPDCGSQTVWGNHGPWCNKCRKDTLKPPAHGKAGGSETVRRVEANVFSRLDTVADAVEPANHATGKAESPKPSIPDHLNPKTIQDEAARAKAAGLCGERFRRNIYEAPWSRVCTKQPHEGRRHSDAAPKEEPVEPEGTCQVCFRKQQTRNSLLVLHGYKRPGEGYIIGRCYACDYAPFEVSCERTKTFITEVLRPWLQRSQTKLAELQARPASLDYEGSVYVGYAKTTKAARGYKTVTVTVVRDAPAGHVPTDVVLTQAKYYSGGPRLEVGQFDVVHHPSYDDLLKRHIQDVEGRIARVQRDIEHYEAKVAAWKPVPWPATKGKASDIVARVESLQAERAMQA